MTEKNIKIIENSINPNSILIIGDVHGKLKEYHDIIKTHKGISIQVGDFGFRKEH